MPREKISNPIKIPCKYFAGVFYCRLGASICSATARRGKTRSKSCFRRYWRKKFPNSNLKAESAPIPLFLPVISRRFTSPNSFFKYQRNYVSRQNRAASRYLKVFEPVYDCFKPSYLLSRINGFRVASICAATMRAPLGDYW